MGKHASQLADMTAKNCRRLSACFGATEQDGIKPDIVSSTINVSLVSHSDPLVSHRRTRHHEAGDNEAATATGHRIMID